MSEERIYEETVMSETSIGETPISEQNTEEMPVQEPVKAKKGFATASLVFGILAFITTLFLVNYVFGFTSAFFTR